MNALPRLKQTRAGWEGSKKESPAAVPDLAFPRSHRAAISSTREMVKLGQTGAAKWHAHQISVRNRTRYSLDQTLFPKR